MGDLGGILECMSILMAMIATNYSRILFSRDIVQSNFVAKLPSKEKKGKPPKPYSKITLSLWSILIEPFYGWMFWRCCKSIKHRKNLYSKGLERFSDELDIVNILKRLRQSHDSLKLILSKQQLKLLKVQGSFLLNPNTTSSSSSSSDELP